MAGWITGLVAALSIAVVERQLSRRDPIRPGINRAGVRIHIAVPDNWNGELIIYGHGIVDPAAPVGLPTTQDSFTVLRDQFLRRGYAVAYTVTRRTATP